MLLLFFTVYFYYTLSHLCTYNLAYRVLLLNFIIKTIFFFFYYP